MEDCTEQRKLTVEEVCSNTRKEIEGIKSAVCFALDELKFMETTKLEGNNIPDSSVPNMAANLTLAFRHLEDARMRLGKAMQAYQGGISILDR